VDEDPYGFIAVAYSSADAYCRAVAICEVADDFPTGGAPCNLVRLPTLGNSRTRRIGAGKRGVADTGGNPGRRRVTLRR
jgi:hypothetical protein